MVSEFWSAKGLIRVSLEENHTQFQTYFPSSSNTNKVFISCSLEDESMWAKKWVVMRSGLIIPPYPTFMTRHLFLRYEGNQLLVLECLTG